MNASSSRAHTIITIEFKQIDTVQGRKSEKLSVINLVDLAGSEKLNKTGATGDRMKEGKNEFILKVKYISFLIRLRNQQISNHSRYCYFKFSREGFG